ncbi:type VII secretion-associated serine protease mycosin [Streptomyces gamaensis]|uniref:Type VII secretion-associated serine protease mycosin n=1 Tax=Streptomyces gamaensis TaxID=1763542 RepID=A0ABW0Z1L6_9ACTN
MHAEEMWKTSTGTGVTVAVVDSGIDADLPDLQGQVLEGKNFSPLPGDAHTDLNGHGTSMAALIAGTGRRGNTTGSYGLAPGTKVLPLRVGGKNFTEDTMAMVGALRYAADSDAKIINISRGSPQESPAESQAIAYALSKGKLIFAAAGNTGDKGNPVEYPAAEPGVIAMAALDRNGEVAPLSQHGPQVVLAAPGVGTVAACPGSTGVCTGDGTSAASALASASAALLWSIHPDWTANQVARVLINTAGAPQSGEKRNDYVGFGAIRPRVALQNPGDPGPPDVSPLTPNSPSPKSNSESAASTDKHATPDNDGPDPKWIAAGVATAAILGAAIVAPALMRRRNRPHPPH